VLEVEEATEEENGPDVYCANLDEKSVSPERLAQSLGTHLGDSLEHGALNGYLGQPTTKVRQTRDLRGAYQVTSNGLSNVLGTKPTDADGTPMVGMAWVGRYTVQLIVMPQPDNWALLPDYVADSSHQAYPWADKENLYKVLLEQVNRSAKSAQKTFGVNFLQMLPKHVRDASTLDQPLVAQLNGVSIPTFGAPHVRLGSNLKSVTEEYIAFDHALLDALLQTNASSVWFAVQKAPCFYKAGARFRYTGSSQTWNNDVSDEDAPHCVVLDNLGDLTILKEVPGAVYFMGQGPPPILADGTLQATGKLPVHGLGKKACASKDGVNIQTSGDAQVLMTLSVSSLADLDPFVSKVEYRYPNWMAGTQEPRAGAIVADVEPHFMLNVWDNIFPDPYMFIEPIHWIRSRWQEQYSTSYTTVAAGSADGQRDRNMNVYVVADCDFKIRGCSCAFDLEIRQPGTGQPLPFDGKQDGRSTDGCENPSYLGVSIFPTDGEYYQKRAVTYAECCQPQNLPPNK